MLLATDLDGTFLGGSELHRSQLYNHLRKNRGMQLVFVTGRGLASVKPLLEDPAIPTPAYIICDGGATIVNGWSLQTVRPLQTPVAEKWPGQDIVRNQLRGVPGLVYQDVPQERRCSFFLKDASLVKVIEQALEKLPCDVVYSAGKYLDVLPAGVNKGASLAGLVAMLGESPDNVLVAGDTLNDLSMYNLGFKGVAVGGCEQGLLMAAGGLSYVFCATAAGAGGILEAMVHYSMFGYQPELEELNNY